MVVWPELVVLAKQHAQEVEPALAPLVSIDMDTYHQLEAMGQLVCLIVRDDMRMVGYVLMAVKRHQHYAKRIAQELAHYLLPEYRKGWTGVKLLRDAEQIAKSLHADLIYWHTKPLKDNSKLLAYLDYELSHMVYKKELS